MKNIILVLSIILLFNNSAYANQKTDTVPLTASIEEIQTATLDDSDDNEKPKKKKKASKKKNKKTKKASN